MSDNEKSAREKSLEQLTRIAVAVEKQAALLLENNRLLRKLLPPEPPRIATDKELDDPSGKGDPIVKISPRDWKGDNFKGQRMSACPPEFLDLLASFFDWAAEKKRNEGDSKHAYDELDGARARGHARRARAAQEKERVKDAIASDDWSHDAAEPSEETPPEAPKEGDDEWT